MDLVDRQIFDVAEPSVVYGTRTTICKAARLLGFDEQIVGKMAIVINELCTNLLKHSKHGGAIIMQTEIAQDFASLNIVSVSDPPGMNNSDVSLQDGVSTAKSLGTGLGAIRRLSDEFDLYSTTSSGTVLSATFRTRQRSVKESFFDLGGISIPKEGEIACGDQYSFVESREKITLMVVDGLGHGVEAAKAARKASDVFQKNGSSSPDQIINVIHENLHETRGAAVAVASVDRSNWSLMYCGVGNISGVVEAAGNSERLISMSGTAGFNVRNVHLQTCKWTPESILIMHSDGLESGWQLSKHRGLTKKTSLLTAALLVRDHRKEIDDCTVVVLKEKRNVT